MCQRHAYRTCPRHNCICVQDTAVYVFRARLYMCPGHNHRTRLANVTETHFNQTIVLRAHGHIRPLPLWRPGRLVRAHMAAHGPFLYDAPAGLSYEGLYGRIRSLPLWRPGRPVRAHMVAYGPFPYKRAWEIGRPWCWLEIKLFPCIWFEIGLCARGQFWALW